MRRDSGIDTLLAFDGYEIQQDNGCWAKFEFRLVTPTPQRPHGIRYSLTLHDRHGRRVLGFDNAHAVKPPKKSRYAGRIIAHDHRHRTAVDKGVPYHFQSAEQLLSDCFRAIDEWMAQEKRR